MGMFARVLLPAVLLLSGSGALASNGLGGGSSPSASPALRIAIQVPRVVHMRVLQQPRHLEVTAADLERGFVLARGVVDVVSTHREGYQMRALLSQGPVVEADMAGLERPMTVRDSAATPMPSMVGKPRPAPYEVEYRLRLAADTVPGTYVWPLKLSVEEP
jgi:hypothetical protein